MIKKNLNEKKIKIFGKGSQSGSIVIMALLVSGFLLSMALTLSAIFIPKLKTAGDSHRSITAFYAAESGIEWCLFVSRKTPPLVPPSPLLPSNGSTYYNGNTNLSYSDPNECFTMPIKSVGTYQGVSRSLEVSF